MPHGHIVADHGGITSVRVHYGIVLKIGPSSDRYLFRVTSQ